MAIITGYWILDGLIVLMITSMTAAYFFMTRKFNYWKERGVFEIKPLPFFGNFASCLTLKQSPGFIFRDLYNSAKEEPYIGLYILDKPALLIRDQEIIKDILIKDFNYFSNRNAMCEVKDRLGNSILSLMKNPTWKIIRAKLTPVYTSGKLKKMFDLLLECTVNLDTYLDKLVTDGNAKMIDAKELFANLTTDMIGTTAFGLNIDSLNNSECEFRKNRKMIFDVNIYRGIQMFIGFFYPELCNFIGVKMFPNECGTFLRYVFWDTIKHRMKSGEKRDDLIDILIELKKQCVDEDLRDFKFDGDDLVAQAAMFFTAGFETSSSVMAFTLYELAVHPEFQNKIRREISDAIDKNGGKITYDMVLSLSYLDIVVSEILRMYPPLPFIDRETLAPYKVSNSNLVIEKGTTIFLSLLGLHYDPKYFPNPEKFDPERFNEKNKHNIPSYAYLPFGEGPRMCIAKRLGLLQAKLGIIKMLYRYEVTTCDKTLMPMTLDPKSPLTTPLDGTLYLNIRKLNTKY